VLGKNPAELGYRLQAVCEFRSIH